jgi:hypothetical protein
MPVHEQHDRNPKKKKPAYGNLVMVSALEDKKNERKIGRALGLFIIV